MAIRQAERESINQLDSQQAMYAKHASERVPTSPSLAETTRREHALLTRSRSGISSCPVRIARLGWNLRTWLAQLQQPAEVVRWEWKRFRRAFVFLAALTTDGGEGFASDAALPTSLRLPCGPGIHRARQVWPRFAGSLRFVHTLFAALLGLSSQR
ncbi:hypothetical protein [Sorangium sp. So ce394]|uniref:hypothetical protein n=1 Tax=Sorangium sp. So ce394 TaxID=3133310 RepID=UPI003F5C42FB